MNLKELPPYFLCCQWTGPLLSTVFISLKLGRERALERIIEERVQRENHGEMQRTKCSRGRRSIHLVKGSQVLLACPSDKGN